MILSSHSIIYYNGLQKSGKVYLNLPVYYKGYKWIVRQKDMKSTRAQSSEDCRHGAGVWEPVSTHVFSPIWTLYNFIIQDFNLQTPLPRILPCNHLIFMGTSPSLYHLIRIYSGVIKRTSWITRHPYHLWNSKGFSSQQGIRGKRPHIFLTIIISAIESNFSKLWNWGGECSSVVEHFPLACLKALGLMSSISGKKIWIHWQSN